MIGILGLGPILTVLLRQIRAGGVYLYDNEVSHSHCHLNHRCFFLTWLYLTQHVWIVDHIVDFLFLVPLSGRREGNGGDVQTTLPA